MKRRQTASKTAILNTLKTSKKALSHEMLQEALNDKYDRATIYRILNQFCEDGLVHKVQGDDGKQYFAMCTGCQTHQHEHNHFHFRCIACGMVECLDDQIQLVLPKGYTAQSFNGLISGNCKACAL